MHEVHCHDNGLFDQLMGWIEGILQFLREGPKGGKLDMNALFAGAISVNRIDQEKAIEEINHLIAWQEAHQKWHQNKTCQKMAVEGGINLNADLVPSGLCLSSTDFGIDEMGLQDVNYEEGSESEDENSEEDELDPIEAERRRRAKKRDHLRRTAGEPVKPPVSEVHKLEDNFLTMLRMVLAD